MKEAEPTVSLADVVGGTAAVKPTNTSSCWSPNEKDEWEAREFWEEKDAIFVSAPLLPGVAEVWCTYS